MSAHVAGTHKPFGRAHPAVLRAARAVMAAGWRVTSIVRPDTALLRGPSHAAGIALDIAPLIGGVGGFGPKTATQVLTLLKRTVPDANWWVVGENDHFHVQLTNGPSRVGILLPGGVKWYC